MNSWHVSNPLLLRELDKFNSLLAEQIHELPPTIAELTVEPGNRRHPRQDAFVESEAKRTILRVGRRGGKTVGLARKAIRRFLRGQRVLYATPTAEQIDRFWYEVTLALAEPIEAGLLYKNEGRHIIEVPGTLNRIRAKTAWNADTLRGDYGDFIIFDEWQLMDEDAWERVGMPMLLDNNGDAAFAYTPPSARSRSTSKARDPRHAAKMFKLAQADTSGKWAWFHWTSADNPTISAEAVRQLASEMTTLARKQELEAEDDVEIEGALWKHALIRHRSDHPDFKRIVVAIDPAVTSTDRSDETGIVVAGLGTDGQGYVLEDRSLIGSPDEWARTAIGCYHKWEADKIIVEVNNGGDLCEHTLRTVEKALSIKQIRASRGKVTRAEPIAALYEQGKVYHVGIFEALEDQMCSTLDGANSPDRVDALVWAISELMLKPERFFVA